MNFLRTIACIVLLLTLSIPAAHSAVKIKDIEYRGNERISNETIFAYLEINKGELYTQKKVDESIKSLFRTGFFSDIRITREGRIMVVEVVENPLINQLAFDGNRQIEDSDILQELSMQPHSVLSKPKMQSDIRRIVSIYQKQGWYSVKVTPKIIKLDQNRVNLIYEIDEGQQATIKKINFSGNDSYSDSELQRALASKESRWYRFFTSADVYDSDKQLFDKELLRRFYMKRGYADFKVTSATAELSPNRDAFLLTFLLHEGRVYKFGDFRISNNIKGLDETPLYKLITARSGKKYNNEELDDTVDVFTNYLGDQGFAFVDIDVQLQKDREGGIVDVDFIIKESYKIYVNKINIKNNTRTLDKVIRREFRIAEGDPYNASKIQRSKQRIENLGFFNKVDFKNKRTDKADKMDIDVEVEETSTGSINFAAGFNTVSGVLGSVGIQENNFLGKGQQVKLDYLQAQKNSNINFSFTEPYFMDRELSAGFDVFMTKNDKQDESSYDSEVQGFVLRTGYNITEHLSHGLRYSLKKEDIRNVSPIASPFIQAQAGKNSVSLIGHTLVYDKLDSTYEPTEGYLLKLNQDLAGLGAQTYYFSNTATGAYFHPIYKKDVIGKVIVKGGHIMGWNDKDVRLNDRFFMGPNHVRGFDRFGIGPRDIATRDSLGGNTYYSGTAEINFPIGLPNEMGVKGAVFSDAGSLFGLDGVDETKVFNKRSVRASAGIGVIWKSPMGTLRFDWAEPFAKESFDDIQKFKFNFGTQF